MPEYLSPGVHIEETRFRPKSIVGVAAGTAAFIGETQMGPVKPHLVDSFRDYQAVFGGVFGDTQYLPHAVQAFFDNGGRRCFVVRIVPDHSGIPSITDFEGQIDDAGNASGLAALLLPEFDEVAVINAPAASDDIVTTVIAHCETYRFRFAVIDAPRQVQQPAQLDPRQNFDSSYAAFYFPWLIIQNDTTGNLLYIPPGGAICGVYARTDVERGVHKATANAVVKNVMDLAHEVSEQTQDVLDPRGVNVIRDFGQRGIRVWGARTLSTDPELKYVNVRRYLIYLERSIQRGTEWAVFEPNGEHLWARLRQIVAQFLLLQWQKGGLLGHTHREAFFVRCDRTTMTQNDLDSGRLIFEIGIALLRPAEFVIVRMAHKRPESD